MREALWLCIDRLCHTPVWRDAETDIPDFHAYYTMDSSCKRRFQEAAEYLNKEQYIGELEDSYRDVMSRQPLWGKMLEDWFLEILTAMRYGMQRNVETDNELLSAHDGRLVAGRRRTGAVSACCTMICVAK